MRTNENSRERQVDRMTLMKQEEAKLKTAHTNQKVCKLGNRNADLTQHWE